MEKRALGEHVAEWANRVGDGLDDLPQEKGRVVLRLLLDEVTIDGENKVNLTLAVPGEELCRLDHRYQFVAVPIMLVASDPAPYACCPPPSRRSLSQPRSPSPAVAGAWAALLSGGLPPVPGHQMILLPFQLRQQAGIPVSIAMPTPGFPSPVPSSAGFLYHRAFHRSL